MNKIIGHFEEKSGNKYLVLDDVDENKEVSKNMKKFGRVLKKKLKRLMIAKKLNIGRNKKKISFESNDDLLINKPVKLPVIIIRWVFSEEDKFYPHFFIDNALYELV